MIDRVAHFRRALRALLMALVVAVTGCAPAEVTAPGKAGARATWHGIVIEEKRMASPGQGVPDKLVSAVEALAPHERITFTFELLDADDVQGMRDLLRRSPAQVVILLNENLLGALGNDPLPTSFLVPSELPPKTIEARFGALRSRHHIAFLSWYPPAQGKLLDHLAMFSDRPLRTVAGLYHTSLMDASVQAGFVAAARARGIEPLVIPYRDLDDFASALERARGRADALLVPVSEAISNDPAIVAQRVAQTGLPAAYSRRDQVREGGLVSVDSPVEEIYEQLARYAVLVLHGADASRLEIPEVTRLETVVNLRAAANLHRPVPYELLVEAKEITGR
jgi:hypothetical protein